MGVGGYGMICIFLLRVCVVCKCQTSVVHRRPYETGTFTVDICLIAKRVTTVVVFLVVMCRGLFTFLSLLVCVYVCMFSLFLPVAVFGLG